MNRWISVCLFVTFKPTKAKDFPAKRLAKFFDKSNKKVSFSGSKIYVEIQAFDSLSESLSRFKIIMVLF